MREQPWHLRHLSTKHYQWFESIAELHELTLAWLKELESGRDIHLLPRGLPPEISKNLWVEGSYRSLELESILDDTHPEDTLARLESSVWTIQSWTLQELLNRSKNSELKALETTLEQASWKQGRDACGKKKSPSSVDSLPELVLILMHHALREGVSTRPFLVKRALNEFVEIDLLFCPHQSRGPDVAQAADFLCRLHFQWLRGFAYQLCPNSLAEKITPSGSDRCGLRWTWA